MENQYYYVASDHLLGVRTNFPGFKWSFGTAMPRTSREAYDRCAVKLRVEAADRVEIPTDSRLGKYHYWSGLPEADELYYDRAFLGKRRLRLAARGVLTEEPLISVNRTYLRYVSHRFMNLHSLGYILTDLAGLLLLRRGLAPVHCSAFQTGDATVLVAAPPNTGKTLTTMMACTERGARFVAEDLAITDGSKVHSVPWTSTFRYYNRVDKNALSRLKNAATSWFPPAELLAFRQPKAITEYIPPDQMVFSADVTHLAILERGERGVESIGVEDAARKVRNLNRYEFNYHKAPFVVAYEFFNPQIDLDGACRAEASILTDLVAGVQQRWTIRSTDATEYAELIDGCVSRTHAPAAA